MDPPLPQQPPKSPRKNRRKKASTTPSNPAVNKQLKSRLRSIQDADGWTHVRRHAKTSPSSVAGTQSQLPQFLAPLHHCDLTLPELAAEHERHRRRWNGSGAEEALKTQLEGMKREVVGITNIVCLALGSPTNLHMDRRADSHLQLAALETIKTCLGLDALPCLMQDPIFDDLDKAFLKTFGYEVVEDPEALRHICGTSLVYMIHPERGMYHSVLRIASPALLISQDMVDLPDSWLEGFNVNDSGGRKQGLETDGDDRNSAKMDGDYTNGIGSERLEDLGKNWASTRFPQMGHTFSGVAIHWPKANQEADRIP